jgi:asparagine N-glycosylation enzyme membrane subunit Stt3
MESSHSGWWSRHGWTVAILLAAFGMAFAVRTIWTYPIIQQFGPLFSYAGGSDSYYHSRVTTYIILNHQNLVFDPLLHYPVGGYNPREPLFDWMNAILGMVFAPFFGGNAVVAGAWFLDLQAPLWAALGVFPVYLIGREVSGKRMGLIAALIFPFLSANIDSSIFGYANYLSFYTFVILIVIYSYIRTVKAVGSRRWVEDYRHPKQYVPGLRAFLRTERTAVKWAVFTGVSLGALALAWQGYTYAVVVIGISLLIVMIVERIRRVDSFGLYVTTWIVGLVGFPMAMPYYIVQHQFAAWFDLPLLLFFGILALLFPFLLLRDVPWVFSIPALFLLVLGAAAFLAVFEPTYFINIVTGQGYFAKTLIYSTVAEAQAPSIDELVVGYGVVTFFLAFAGLAIFIYVLARGKFKRHHVVFLVFAILSIYLPISAAKFFLLGSPAFALLPAEAIRRALDVGGYPELRRTVASLSDRRSQAAAFRKAFKPRHVLIMLLILMIVLPNVWVSIDAGIPGNTKSGVSAQVYDTLPTFLKGNSSTESNYFGAAGTTIDTSNQYDSAGYNWLAEQDSNTPPALRPAFVSWWDYGFQAIDQGNHPSVADNFQNGIDPAGQFLLAQNESNAIAVLTTTLLQAEQTASGDRYLPPALNTILQGDGLNLTQLHNLLANTSTDVPLVVAHPERYLPVNPSTLTADNAMYLAMSYFLATSQTLNGVAKIYDDVQSYTGWSIRYDMADSRLIPFSGDNTGIFYAPADLTGRIIDSAGLPATFFNVTVLGSDGNYYPLGQVPADVSPVNYYINYFSPFYNSMIYRTYFGYNGTQIGLSGGIPGLEGAAGADPIEPGWMLQHFEVVYKTAYYCANATEAKTNPSCYVPVNTPEALSLAKKTNGSANTSAGMYFSGGESMLEYYPGQSLYGQVRLPNGAPVGGARVTVFDQWGTPHMSVVTSPTGTFSVVLPPGNDSLNVTTGTFLGLSQQGNLLLKQVNITVPNAVGLSFNAPSLQEMITLPGASVSGLVYFNNANNSAYLPNDTVVSGAQVVLWGSGNLSKITTTTDASGAFALSDVAPGVYNYNVIYRGYNFTESPVTVSPPPAAPANATAGLTVGKIQGFVLTPGGTPANGAVVTLGDALGVVRTNVTNVTGRFGIAGFTPGNYTLTASMPGTSERSIGVRVPIDNPGAGYVGNLTLAPTASVSATLEANGAPVGGVPVQFLPIASYNNGSVSPLAWISSAGNNGTTAISGPNGAVSLSLPLGNYSVSALGYVGSTLYAGVGEVAASPLTPNAAVVLSLGPAIRLSGTVAPVGSASTNDTGTVVFAYSAAGAPVTTWATNGSYAFYLPAGAYTVLALEGPRTALGTMYAGLGSVSLSYPTTVNLRPSVAVAARFFVGTTLPGNVLVPASGARVTVAAGSGGPTVTSLAGTDGTAVVYVPAALPLSATSYCVTAGSVGFTNASVCGISPNGLQTMTRFALSLATVPVTVVATGVPPGTSVTVNLTARSVTAVNQTLTGGPTWTVSLAPGSYQVSGWAPTGSGSVLYLPTSVRTESVPFGATSGTLSLALVAQTNSTGTVTLPSGGALPDVTVTLSSPLFNHTMNGTDYTTGFFAPVGSYSAYATVESSTTTYAALLPVTISAGGTVSPTVPLTTQGFRISGKLVDTNGLPLAFNGSLTLTTTSGASALIPITNGTFTAVLPGNQSYAVSFAVTTLAQGPSGAYSTSWVEAPGATCVLAAAGAQCAVTAVGTTQLVPLTGTLTSLGVPGLIAGTIRLYGPAGAPTLTVLTTANGTFSTRLLPGRYSLYAAGGGGSEPLAGFASIAVSLNTAAPVTVVLSPTWTDTISVASPTGAPALLGRINVTVTNAFGVSTAYSNVTTSTQLMVALPVGSYTVSAASFGAPNGLPANASASASVKVVNGNVATALALTYLYTYTVRAAIVGTNHATVTSPGTASFAFSVRNTGNVPVVVHAVGSPAFWGFNFTFTNATLLPGPTGNALSASVVIQISAGTESVHPPVVIDFELANGTVVGAIEPIVNIVAYYGVSVGTTSSSPAQVGVDRAIVPFYLANTGNINESVSLSIVDAYRIANLGWTATFRSISGPLTNDTVKVDAFTNTTYSVNLTAVEPIFAPVDELTIQASVVFQSGSYQAFATLKVPTVSVRTGTTNGTAAITVTGPSVGPQPSVLPDWVVPLLSFVPALALVLGVITYRWWRSRRWTRR